MAKAPAAKEKGNEFDDRREGLVVERKTVFPAELNVSADRRPGLREQLHADPKAAKVLEYVRCPTGFIRTITVTADDLTRLKG
jgi:hypothetical protein